MFHEAAGLFRLRHGLEGNDRLTVYRFIGNLSKLGPAAGLL